MKLNELVRELRRRLGWTQQQLAVAVKVAVRTISVYETGDTTGSPEVTRRFEEIADHYGFSDLYEPFHAYSQFPGHGTVTLRHVESLRESIELLRELTDEANGKLRTVKGRQYMGAGMPLKVILDELENQTREMQKILNEIGKSWGF